MATIKQAKDSLLDRIGTLADTTVTTASDTILLTDALNTLDKGIDEETTVAASPDYHYRNTRPEYGIWGGYTNAAGMTIVDEMANPLKARGYWHSQYTAGADGCFTGQYSGGMKSEFSSSSCYYRCNSQAPAGAECYISGTTAVGELGHYRLIVGYKALEVTRLGPQGDDYHKENLYVGNAELNSKECYLRYKNQTLALRLRSLTTSHDSLSEYDTGNTNTTSRGGCSYNKTREELVVHNRVGTSQDFRVKIYKNISELNRKTNIATVLTAAEGTSASLDYSLADGYLSTDIETLENNKIVLCDSGVMFVTTHEPSTFLHIAKLTRDSGDTALTYAPTGQGGHGQQALGSITYGVGTDSAHGHMLVQSRSKKNVFLFCVFYQYQRGMVSYVVSKHLNSYAVGYNYESETMGANVGPYGDNDFVISRNHNWDTPHQQSVICFIQKPDGLWVETDTGNQLDNSGWWTTFYPCLVPLNI
jgi:hypothetical protein